MEFVILAVGFKTGAEFGKLFFGEHLVYLLTGGIHLLGYLGLQGGLTVKEREEFVGLIALLVHQGADVGSHVVKFFLQLGSLLLVWPKGR